MSGSGSLIYSFGLDRCIKVVGEGRLESAGMYLHRHFNILLIPKSAT